MGTPLPPVDDGILCDVCWAPGEPFASSATPDTLKLSLTSLLPGEFESEVDFSDLLRTRWLPQTLTPCVWSLLDDPLLWSVLWSAGRSAVRVIHLATSHFVFDKVLLEHCKLDLTNGLIVPTGNIAYTGFANITFI